MREFFRAVNFHSKSLGLIARCNQIVEDYQGQGLRLTLRQLYYQLVSRNVITNEERSYKNLGNLLSDARLAGMVDWDAIEDRVRVPRAAPDWNNLQELVESALRTYRLPRWEDQDNYVELWVEKDALAGVLWPIAHKYHITLMVNRGYSSQSAMYESAARFRDRCGSLDEPKPGFLLYLGDHDPSGEDMVRDIQDRLDMFGTDVEVRKLALTKEQVVKYNPPPNPAKMSDSRAPGYVRKHGKQSWEVDALPPEVLTQIITRELDTLTDAEKIKAWIACENADKAKLRAAAKQLMGG